MRSFVLLAVALALASGCWFPPSVWAGNPVEPGPSTKPATPGVELANAISVITGAAISPLLGVSAVGAWKYFHAATPQERARLPWFAQRWFWIPAFVLVTACFLKDTLGLAAPRLLKKPLDVADTIGHKINGLIAAGAFVPLVAAVFQSTEPDAALPSSTGFLAAIDLSWLGNGILVPVSIIAFFIVFLASNAINVLILLSPFAVVDAALKGFRLLVLLTVAATAFANPWLGAAWALVIIAIAYFIAGWSFRLSHFGLVFVWDFITLRRHRFVPDRAKQPDVSCSPAQQGPSPDLRHAFARRAGQPGASVSPVAGAVQTRPRAASRQLRHCPRPLLFADHACGRPGTRRSDPLTAALSRA